MQEFTSLYSSHMDHILCNILLFSNDHIYHTVVKVWTFLNVKLVTKLIEKEMLSYRALFGWSFNRVRSLKIKLYLFIKWIVINFFKMLKKSCFFPGIFWLLWWNFLAVFDVFLYSIMTTNYQSTWTITRIELWKEMVLCEKDV